MKFCDGIDSLYEYGVHLAAGFGSYFSFLLIKKISENPTKDNEKYLEWLRKISNQSNPDLTILNNTLIIKSDISKKIQDARPKTQEPEKIEIKPEVKPQPEPEPSLVMSEEQRTISQKPIAKSQEPKEIYKEQVIPPLNIQNTEADTALPKFETLVKLNATEEVKNIIAEQTGYTVDMLEDNLDLEADLGIDTVKQVEIFGKITTKFNLEVPENLKLNIYNTIAKIVDFVNGKLEPIAKSQEPKEIYKEKVIPPLNIQNTGADTALPKFETLVKLNATEEVKNIIAEQTGYTVDMLEDNLDLEADLGIDTVKQVEIFGKITTKFNLEVPENLKLNIYNTIAKIVDFVNGKLKPITKSQELKEIHTEQVIPPLNIQNTEADTTSPKFETLEKLNVPEEVKAIIAEQTGYTVDMLEDNLDLEADLGIDTVKQVEIFGKITTKFNLEVPENLKLNIYNTIAKIVEFVNSNIEQITKSQELKEIHTEQVIPPLNIQTTEADTTSPKFETLEKLNVPEEVKAIIAEQTGYSIDMLEDNLDLEADLGIDTVKQVEIFGKITTKFNLEVPENLKLNIYNTIAKIVDFVNVELEPKLKSHEPKVIPTEQQTPVSSIRPPASGSFQAPDKNESKQLSEQKVPLNGNVAKEVKKIISELTGYTTEILEDEIKLEELGITSIKMVEVCGKVSLKFKFTIPDDFKISELTTISEIPAFVKRRVSDIESTIKQAPGNVFDMNKNKAQSHIKNEKVTDSIRNLQLQT